MRTFYVMDLQPDKKREKKRKRRMVGLFWACRLLKRKGMGCGLATPNNYERTEDRGAMQKKQERGARRVVVGKTTIVVGARKSGNKGARPKKEKGTGGENRDQERKRKETMRNRMKALLSSSKPCRADLGKKGGTSGKEKGWTRLGQYPKGIKGGIP